MAGALAALLLCPLTLLGLDDGVARNLGLGLPMARFSPGGWAFTHFQRHVGERGGRYRLYRPVCAADGEDAGRPPPGVTHDVGAVAGGVAAVADRSGDDWVAQVWRRISTGAIGMFGAPPLLWLLPFAQSAATPPPMNFGDKKR